MATHTKLKLPRSRRVALFRLVDDRLRNDPVLSRTVKVWRSWRGEADDAAEGTVDQCPLVRLSIYGTGEKFWAASTMKGTLTVAVDLMVAGTCLDDLDNLWAAVERALYPADAAARNAFQRTLCDAGAWPGVIEFAQPAFDPRPQSDSLVGEGRLSLDYRFDTNPTSPGL